jgi:carbon storage regulator
MLVLSRRPQQGVSIGRDVKVTVIEVCGDKVRLGFEAPDEVKILRTELESDGNQQQQQQQQERKE